MSAQCSHGVAKDNVGTVPARCGKLRQCRHGSRTVWQKTPMSVGTVFALTISEEMREKMAPLSDRRFFPCGFCEMRLLLTVLTWLPLLLTVLCPEMKSSFLLGDFRGLLCSQVSAVFPSIYVSCVPKCLCFLRAQVFVSVVFPSVHVSCVPKRLCLFCSQAFVSAVCQNVSVCCVLMVV